MIFKFAKTSAKKRRSYSSRTLFPVLTHEQLLANPKRQLLLTKMRDFVDLQEDYYVTLYQQLLRDYAEYVQVLPAEVNGKLAQLLDLGIQRAYLAAQLCHEEKRSALFSYAAFTAAVLQDVGRVMQQVVIISDKQGEFVSEWFPVLGNLIPLGDFYKIRFLNKRWNKLMQYVTPVLACNLLAPLGLKWLSSNYAIFEMWLAVLIGDHEGARALKLLLQLVEDKLEALQKEFDFAPVEAEIKEPVETKLGEAFVDWLIDGLEDESIPSNTEDAPVQITEENVLLEYPAIFKLFIEAYPRYRDWTVVYQQYNMLGLAKLSGYDYKFEQFFSKLPGTDARLSTITAKHFLSQQGRKAAQAKQVLVVPNKDVLFPNRELSAPIKNHALSATKSAESVLDNLSKDLRLSKKASPKMVL